MHNFRKKRIFHLDSLNNPGDNGFALLCGISRVVDSTFAYKFRGGITWEQVEGIIAVVLIKGGAAISRDVLTTTPKGDFYMGGSIY